MSAAPLQDLPAEPLDGAGMTDDEIRGTLLKRLRNLNMFNVDALTLSVAAGEVTLEGVVRESWQVTLVEDIARSIPGVRGVENHLRVAPRHLPAEVAPGTNVVNERREHLGTVARSYGDSFLMNTPQGRQVYVPFHTIRGVMPGAVIVNRAIHVDGSPG